MVLLVKKVHHNLPLHLVKRCLVLIRTILPVAHNEQEFYLPVLKYYYAAIKYCSKLDFQY